MADKVKCPICGTTRELEPHPTKPGRQVAYCTCRGTKVGVVETGSKPARSTKPKDEGETQ